GLARVWRVRYGAPSTRGKRRKPMDIVAEMLIMVIGWYIWLLIASAILSWLIVFNVLNARNQFVDRIGDFLYRITEPALRPIRRFVPYIGGVDISPVVLILLLIFAQRMLARIFLQ
ncbi:MAG: YggT family protein, partial [Rhodospirillales bacterium]